MAVIKSSKMEATSSTEADTMWIEKYRPNSLADVISHKDIIGTIDQLIGQNRLPHLLFYGPPGTGKTSTILAVARKLNGHHWKSMTLELNASDARGIDVVRNQIKSFASTASMFQSGCKLVVLDEADAMTKAAQFSLRRVIEQFSKHIRFVLICNYVNKIIPALQSRCTRFRFSPLRRKEIVRQLEFVSAQENVTLGKDGLKAVEFLAEGDMRKCLNILQACHMAYDKVNQENVHLCTGTPLPKDIEAILHELLNSDFKQAYHQILDMQLSRGIALMDIVNNVHKLVLRLDLPPELMCFVLDQLAHLEHRLTVSTDEKVQLASLVAIFQIVRAKIES